MAPFPPAGAEEQAEPVSAALVRVADSIGLRPTWQRQAHIKGVAVSLWACELTAGTGETAHGSRGVGKGRTDAETRARALGEALERYLAGPASLDWTDVHFTGAGRLAAGVLADEASSPLLARQPESELACVAYHSLHDDTEVSVPLYLSAPWYAGPDGGAHRDRVGDRTDYGALSRYAVSSGYGLAPDLHQATVHALMETAERDACSLLTLRTQLYGQSLTVLDPSTLPDDLASLHGRAENEVKSRVHLIDATSDLDIPTVLAYTPPHEHRPYLRGQAAALHPYDAVEGALTEILESAVARRHAPPEPVSMTLLEPYPALRRCARFDLTDALRQARTALIPDPAEPRDPVQRLHRIVARLEARGFTTYRKHIARLPEGVSAVHILVPGLERFFAVVKGALILPGPRGREAS